MAVEDLNLECGRCRVRNCNDYLGGALLPLRFVDHPVIDSDVGNGCCKGTLNDYGVGISWAALGDGCN